MKTDELVDALARDAGVVPRRIVERRIALAAAAGLAASLVLMALLFGVRADFGAAVVAVLLKVVFGIAAAAGAAPLLLELARPNTRARHVAVPLILLSIVSIGIALVAFLVTPADARMMSWLGGSVPECLYRIPVLAAPIAAALVLAVRGLGATRLRLAGAAIGAMSGSLAAIPYAGCCPMDSVLYVVSWYPVAILFCAGVGALFIGRALRW